MPKKGVESVEYRNGANTVFEVSNPIISGRPNVRLFDTPTHEPVGYIIKPKVNELINLARNRESRIYCQLSNMILAEMRTFF